MLPYLFKYAIRNLRINWSYTLINFVGVTIGIVSLMVIGLWIGHELSYDQDGKYSDRIYRFTIERHQPDGVDSHVARTYSKWIELLPDNFAAIEKMARLWNMGKISVKAGEEKFDARQVYMVNPDFLTLFDIKLIAGKSEKALTGSQKIMVAQSIADRYFKGRDMVGKTVEMTGTWDKHFIHYEVTGIFRDFPENAHFHPQMLVSMATDSVYNDAWTYNYLLLREGNSANNILDHFSTFANEHITSQERSTITPHLQRLTDIHLRSDKERELEKNGDIKFVYFFGAAGFIALGLALINAINLSQALLIKRKRALAISKVFGARLGFIFAGFFIESLLLLTAASFAALVILNYNLPRLIDFLPSGYIEGQSLFVGVGLLVIIVAGSLLISLPQLMVLVKPFTNFHPGKINLVTLMQTRRSGSKRLLVIGQFTASIVLIICALYFTKQRNYLLDHRLGAGSDPVVLLGSLNSQVKDRYFQFKNQAEQNRSILSVTGTMQAPSEEFLDAMHFTMSDYPQGETPKGLFVSPVDANFLDFYNLPIIAGRNFAPYNRENPKEEYVVNETALKFLGFNDPMEVIGRQFKPEFSAGIFKGGTIVGVVKDFCFSTMKDEIHPFVFFQQPIWYWNFLVKIDRNHTDESVRYLKTVWNTIYPDYVFDFTFMDQTYNQAYKQEIAMARISNYFMVLTLIIAMLGLYGLASITIEQRVREIGIRKVIGAASLDIVLLLNRDFTLWVVSSVVIAIPVAWYLLDRWNENYAYHAPVSWWIFGCAGAAALFVSWLTTSYRTIRASRKNPIDVLREE